MASATKQTRIKRTSRAKKAGKANKKARAKNGTPKFPIHVDSK